MEKFIPSLICGTPLNDPPLPLHSQVHRSVDHAAPIFRVAQVVLADLAQPPLLVRWCDLLVAPQNDFHGFGLRAVRTRAGRRQRENALPGAFPPIETWPGHSRPGSFPPVIDPPYVHQRTEG